MPRSILSRENLPLLLALIGILALAGGLRFYGLNWDSGSGIPHPDERSIVLRVIDCLGWEKADYCAGPAAESGPESGPESGNVSALFSVDRNPLNPRWFNYGSLPLYMLKIAELVTDAGYPELRIAGRVVSAVADVITVALVFIIGTQLFNRRVGLLAALFTALAVLHIQLSHFLTVDSLLTLFTTASLLFAIRTVKTGNRRYAVLAGTLFGLALAVKFAAAPLGLPIAVAIFLSFATARERITAAMLSAAAFFIAFFIGQPFAILDITTYIGNLLEQSSIIRTRAIDVPFTRQFINTTSYVYEVTQLGSWGLGPALGVIGWVGMIFGLVRAVALRRKSELLIVLWVVVYFAINGSFEAKFMRYLLPITPFLMIYGAAMLVWLTQRLTARLRKTNLPVSWFAYAPVMIVIVATVHYALAFSSIYGQEFPFVRAADWLEERAQERGQSVSVVKEHWEEGLPARAHVRFIPQELPLYNTDTREKYEVVSDLLSQADYMVLPTHRLYATIPRLPDRYPIASRYYEMLFNGELGYQVVRIEGTVAELAGISYFPDPFARVSLKRPDGLKSSGQVVEMGWADENFIALDHPYVLILENVEALPAAELFARIYENNRDLTSVVNNVPSEGPLLTASEWQQHRTGTTWGSAFFLSNASSWIGWLPWLLAVYALSFVGWPLFFVLFRRWSDGGWIWARIGTLLLASWVSWILAASGVLQLGLGSAIVALSVVAGISALALIWVRRDLVQFARTNTRRLLLYELMFLSFFAVFVLIRFGNPDLWHLYRGGEKPVDFAVLNAVALSSVIPPYDPWYAGGTINYYYYGLYMVGWLIRLTGLDPAVAYNLALPLLYAFTTSAAFLLARQWTLELFRSPSALLRRATVLAGLGGLFFVAIAGNWDGIWQLIDPENGALLSGNSYDYWRSSRVINSAHEITEFPFFSFLFGDLHPHVIVIPFAMLALALAYTTGRAFRQERAVGWLGVIVTGFVVGALYPTNIWDYPLQLTLSAIIIGVGILSSTARGAVSTVIMVLGATILMVGVGYVAFLPYNLRLEGATTSLIMSAFQTPLLSYLAVHATFAIAAILWLIRWLFMPLARAVHDGFSSSILRQSTRPLIVAIVGSLLVLAALLIVPEASRWTTAAFATVLSWWLLVAALSFWRHQRMTEAVISLVAAFSFAVTVGVEIFTLTFDEARQNTVFKSYIQVWWLLAIVSSIMLFTVTRDSLLHFVRFTTRVQRLPGGEPSQRLPRGLIWGGYWARAGIMVVIVSVVVISGLAYPVFATPARLSQRFDTSFTSLDGARFMSHVPAADIPSWCVPNSTTEKLNYVADAAAIDWLQQNTSGVPVIVEGLMPEYCWGSRIAIYTGFPSVIGWNWHQRQRRPGYEESVLQRVAMVNEFYTTTELDKATNFLTKFGVQYIVVGSLERVVYPPEGLDKFTTLKQQNRLEEVFRYGETVVYRIL